MSLLDSTLANLAPGVAHSDDLPGSYNPRHGLAIYCLPIPGQSTQAPGVVLGEALAARSGLGCTLLEGIPKKIPEGAVVVATQSALRASRPDLLEDVPDVGAPGQYAIRLGRSALVTGASVDGLAAGMQTLAMLVLRHNEDSIPGAVIVDAPLCQGRGLAVELQGGEITANLLMQIASFAATFKANRLHIILDRDFNPSRQIPGMDTFVQTCQSYGIALGVRLPWLGAILSGEKTIMSAWAGLRAVVRLFNAGQAALDDPLPSGTHRDDAVRLANSIVNGEPGIGNFSVDAALLDMAGCPASELRAMGVSGWIRLWDGDTPFSPAHEDMPLIVDVQSPVPGFSSRTAGAYHQRLDAAVGWLKPRQRRELMISFRNIGVSHMWQNLLYPAATGLITAWGVPDQAEQSAWLFANLLYGESATEVMGMWDAVTAAFPQGLSPDVETFLRRTAFGAWPESDAARRILVSVDWNPLVDRIMAAAEKLRDTAQNLARNASTLAGAKLSLQAISWLHTFSVLMPELELRRKNKYDDDGRTEPIAAELHNNFQSWLTGLRELSAESGLEVSEMARIESMGLRLKGLCEGIFE